MSAIHINEATGSDDTGKGTAELPYQSLAFALFTSPDAKLLIFDDEKKEYKEPSQSALKKGKKGADGLEKKRKKAEELAEREAKEEAALREKRDKQLEESKKIVLTEDPSLPKASKVWGKCLFTDGIAHLSSVLQGKLGNLTPLRGQRVSVSGWVHRKRDQKGIIFVVLRDGTGYLQCVLSGQVVRFELHRVQGDQSMTIFYRHKLTTRSL